MIFVPRGTTTHAGGGSWHFLDTGDGMPEWNMALDEALMEFASRTGLPVLRLYGWRTPAATFGYSQRYAEVQQLTALRPLIRRTTGGGLVPHDHDWTYSLVFPPSHPWYRIHARESYHAVHDWLRGALARTGLPTELASCCQPQRPGQCFIGAEEFDVLWAGAKIAGAAQRRSGAGLLIQGSVQSGTLPILRSQWEEAMRQVASDALGVQWRPLEPGHTLLLRAGELQQAKYSQVAYNCRR